MHLSTKGRTVQIAVLTIMYAFFDLTGRTVQERVFQRCHFAFSRHFAIVSSFLAGHCVPATASPRRRGRRAQAIEFAGLASVDDNLVAPAQLARLARPRLVGVDFKARLAERKDVKVGQGMGQ